MTVKFNTLENLQYRFWSRVKKTSGCWPWTGFVRKKSKGFTYGGIMMKGKKVSAHRISYQISCKRKIKSTDWVLHKCDNPICVRPSHLYIGTPQDNMNDRSLRHRQNHWRGSESPNSKLTEDQVKVIKKFLKMGTHYLDLSNFYKVSPSTIEDIKYNWTWTHVK